jgi:hypothetical protein
MGVADIGRVTVVWRRVIVAVPTLVETHWARRDRRVLADGREESGYPSRLIRSLRVLLVWWARNRAGL